MPGYFWPYRPSRNVRLDPEVYTTIGQPVFFTIRAAHGLAPFAQPQFASYGCSPVVSAASMH